MDENRWDAAVNAATAGMSEQGARERRRHARAFAEWCTERGIAPHCADQSVLKDFIEALPGEDPQRAAKARCAIRAVLREIDPDQAARVAGLGNQARLLESLPDGLAALVRATMAQQPKRQAVVASALTRLFAWCAEVDADPLSITPTDLPQFRKWLTEVGTTIRETMVVAGASIAVRHSPSGRKLLNEEVLLSDIALNVDAPLTARCPLESDRGQSLL